MTDYDEFYTDDFDAVSESSLGGVLAFLLLCQTIERKTANHSIRMKRRQPT